MKELQLLRATKPTSCIDMAPGEKEIEFLVDNLIVILKSGFVFLAYFCLRWKDPSKRFAA